MHNISAFATEVVAPLQSPEASAVPELKGGAFASANPADDACCLLAFKFARALVRVLLMLSGKKEGNDSYLQERRCAKL